MSAPYLHPERNTGAVGPPAGAPFRPGLTNLRALLTLSIFLYHSLLFFEPWLGLSANWLYRLSYPGMLSAQGFLVIAGFLLSEQLERAQQRGGFRWGPYLLRRMARLGPSYWLYLAVVGVLAAGGLPLLAGRYGAAWPADNLWWFVPFQGFWTLQPQAASLVVEHLWFVSTVVLVYLLLPGVQVLAGRRWPEVVLGLLVLEMLGRGLVYSQFGHNQPAQQTLFVAPVFRLSPALLGALAYWVYRYRPAWLGRAATRWNPGAVAGVVLVYLLAALNNYMYTGPLDAALEFTLLSIPFVALVVLVLPAGGGAHPWLLRLDQCGYSYYLWHPLLLWLAAWGLGRSGLAPPPHPVWLGVVVPVVGGAVYLWARGVFAGLERPVLAAVGRRLSRGQGG